MGAPAARVHEMSKEWVMYGANVNVLTAFPNHPTGTIPEQYKGKIFQKEMVDNINVYRTFIYAAANKGFFKRVISYFSFFMSSVFFGLFCAPKANVIIATTPQFLCSLSGVVHSFFRRKPLVLEVRDLWPDSIVAVGVMEKNSILIKILYLLEKFVYWYAEKIIIVSKGFEKELIKKGVNSDKLFYMPNGIDDSLFYPKKKNYELLKKLSIKNKFIVSFIGTHGMAHGLNTVIECAAELQKEKKNNVQFLFVGEGAKKQELIEQANNKKLLNCLFVDKVDKNKIPDYYSISDASLVVLKKNDLFKTVLPSKMFEIMGMSIPIILGVEGVAADVIKEANAGILVEPENSILLKNAIESLYNNVMLKEKLGTNGVQFVRVNYNRKIIAKSYLEIL